MQEKWNAHVPISIVLIEKEVAREGMGNGSNKSNDNEPKEDA
jgi:hypothetical protein